MDKDLRLDKLTDRKRAADRAEIEVSEAAISARLGGATWEEIGLVLGISKQGAFARYGHMLPYAYPSPDLHREAK
jgi:hypothetical protein